MCPPGVDQTMRTSQCWQLIAPVLHQSQGLSDDPRDWNTHLHEVMFDPKGLFGAFGKLARPVVPSSLGKSSVSPSSNTDGHEVQSKRCMIETLPVELVLMLLECGDLSKADILSLALAYPVLRHIILSHVQSSYVKAAAPWAGTPIVVLGNYSLDLPAPCMRDGAVIKNFAAWAARLPAQPGMGMRRMGGGKPPARQYFWVCADLPTPVTPQTEERGWRDALRKLCDLHPDCSSAEVESIGQQLSCSNLFPADKTWVLRNLTTKEYYVPQPFPDTTRQFWSKFPRQSRRDDEDEKVARPETLGFDDVMWLRTCWTSIFNGGERKDEWAGHCFDIVATDVFDVEGRREGWTDVSKKLLMEAKAEWDGER